MLSFPGAALHVAASAAGTSSAPTCGCLFPGDRPLQPGPGEALPGLQAPSPRGGAVSPEALLLKVRPSLSP